jgi:hypothetical protein
MPRSSRPPRLDHFYYTWRKVQITKLPRYAAFSAFPSLHTSSVQIFSSAPCSQTKHLKKMHELKFQLNKFPRSPIIIFSQEMYVLVHQLRRRRVLAILSALLFPRLFFLLKATIHSFNLMPHIFVKYSTSILVHHHCKLLFC